MDWIHLVLLLLQVTLGAYIALLIFIDKENGLRFMERSHDPQRSSSATAEFRIMLQPS